MITAAQKDAIVEQLFGIESASLFAVLDGASVPGLLDKLKAMKPENTCLFSGELAPDVAQTAPYLVSLARGHEFTDWVVAQGWGEHWGIFAAADEATNFRQMRNHFRTFLMVRRYDGKSLYFRYYDPRVMRVYLPTCTADELAYVCGPIAAYFMESRDAAALLRFDADGGQDAIPLPGAVKMAS